MGLVSSVFARKMVAAADVRLDKQALLISVGVDPDGQSDITQMIPDTDYYALLEALARAETGPPQFQLKAGASMLCEDYGAFGMAWKAAPTLRGSFERAERYARLLTSVAEYELRVDAHDAYFLLHRDGSLRGLQLSNEATLVSVATICAEVTTDTFRPRAVYFKHSAPSSTTEYEAFFGCEVVFQSDRNAFLLGRRMLDLPNRLGDETMSRFFNSLLDQEIDKLDDEKPIEDLVRAQISKSLSAGLPRMDDVARSLAMSDRTLHRRLAERRLTFQVLVEQSRRRMAERLLQQPRHSLAEVAFLTGFSEQSAFSRAFKRWTGSTPASFRQASLS